jgi:hypothetical protein
MNDADRIDWNQQNAYVGELGASREKFCREFLGAKQELLAEITQEQAGEALANGAGVTCRKGCAHAACCMEYIEATLQECDAVVYYLYQHPTSLAGFLANFQDWQEKLSRNDKPHRDIQDMYRKLFDPGNKEIKDFAELPKLDQEFYELQVGYFDLQLTCPFLSHHECLIYTARPFVCAAAYSSAPLDLCATNGRMLPPINRSTPPPEALNSIFYCGEIKNLRMHFLPLTVYDILVRGYECLASAAGSSELLHEARVQQLIYRV